MKKRCSRCAEPSLPGLRVRLCQYHYNESIWGRDWADRMRELRALDAHKEDDDDERISVR